jgi:preprotein translocase subunit SecG
MESVLLALHLLLALALIGVILLQRSEGGALGIGGGGGGNLFSSRGVGNTLTRTTAFLAAAFFFTSIALTVLATRGTPFGTGSAFDQVTQPPAPAATGTQTQPAPPGLPNPDEKPKVPVQQ